jgi:hypothetical protein
VPLRLHQVEYLEKNGLPKDFSQSLVFVNEGLTKLKNRIKELQQVCVSAAKKFHLALTITNIS